MKNPENKYSAEKTKTDLDSLELKANLSPEQREHLEVLKDKMKKALGGKNKQELAKAGDLKSLKNYQAVLTEILEFLRTKKMNIGKDLSFKTIKELEAVYSPEQIAHDKTEVNEITKVFIGELYPGIFTELPEDIEHIYTSFPEGKIVLKEITIGGKTAKELAKEIKKKGYKIDGFTVKELLGNKDFKPQKKVEKLDLVILSVKELGFPDGATTREIYEKAQELGLKLVPAEVGPQLRLQYEDQPMGEYLLVGSEPLAASSGFLIVFNVLRNDRGRWLGTLDGNPGGRWLSNGRWVFASK